MSTSQQTALVDDRQSLHDRAAAAVIGLAFVTFVLAWAALFEVAKPGSTVAGISLYDLFGVFSLVLGAIVAGIGLVSRFGYVETDPSASAGLVTGGVFGLLGFVVVGLIVSQTLGINGPYGIGWFVPASLGGIGLLLATVLPREDVGSTLPAGAFAVFVGVILLTRTIGPEWTWHPTDVEPTFSADIVVPGIMLVVSLLVVWAGAKAYDGFGSRGRQTGAYVLITLNAFGMLAVLFLLVAFIVTRGWAGLFRGFSLLPFHWPFVTNAANITNDVNGIWPAIVGTVWLVVGAVVIAVPMGVGAAIFLTEYAEQGRFTRVIEIATNGLWSTPSIVYGLFGLAFFVPRFGNHDSILAGQFVLGFMLLPLVVTTSREALKAVPDEYRDASAALGVSQWQTIRSVVLPAALPGVVTGIILGIGRIAGETAPILLVTSSSSNPTPQYAVDVLGSFTFTATPPFVTNDALLQGSTALPYQLYALVTAGIGRAGTGGIGGSIDPWSTALVLLLVVLSFYAVGITTRWYFRRKLHQ
ncbi:phosphate ABC transporter permease PstA [Halomarina pelagica]|uniref:phosphate ABC transporter permease PstA n=1 Tax=Halomarina pelagica TaxID=2961599 RepID=UPI0020C23991|nr:phosphate ABC transporter permease PstA [Halomarina sp. BND7]